MQVAYVRFALIFIATTIGASLDTYAASRVWVLNAVRFEDGAVARGSFSYDDVTRTFDYWSVRVSEGQRFPSLTYVPGNSATYYIPGWVYFVSSETAPTGLARFLNLWPSSPLDGQNATVPLDLSKSYESFEELIVRDQRKIVSGSLLLGGSPSAAAENTVVVVEYHNLSRDHYFMTALPGEIALLDSGQMPGWHRTGEEFRALSPGAVHANSLPVCRYYGLPQYGLDTHFFSYLPFECDVLATESPQKWLLESAEIFRFPYPFTCDDEATGRLLYRLFNNRADVNHRYTINASVRDEMIAKGWILEGYGNDGFFGCVMD